MARLSWEVASDHDEVHGLLCACDAFNATLAAPAPVRNSETTRRWVADGVVQLGRSDALPVATFTLAPIPTFIGHLSEFPAAAKPLYLGRLAVLPALLAQGSLVGAQCLRRVTVLARARGADAVRAEANPDLVKVYELLALFGFKEYATEALEGQNRRGYLQLNL